MKTIDEVWVLIYGTTFGEWKEYSELSGYDWDTGEEIYETNYERGWDPHEEVKEVFTNLKAARDAQDRLVHEFEEAHKWPWNNAHYEFNKNEAKVEFTNNEDSVWFTIRHMKNIGRA